MTEGKGSTAAIDDAAGARPSPAKSPRFSAIRSPLSLDSYDFLRNENPSRAEILKSFQGCFFREARAFFAGV